MNVNKTAFGRVQNKGLQAGVGEALDAVVAKVDDVDKRMLNYTGDWVSGNEYHENDVVTWATDGHLYEVIKAHTSSATFDPDNPEYYKAMTAHKYVSKSYNISTLTPLRQAVSDIKSAISAHKRVVCVLRRDTEYDLTLEFNVNKLNDFKGVVATGIYRDPTTFYPVIYTFFLSTEVRVLSKTTLTAEGCTKEDVTQNSLAIFIEQ